MRPCSGCAKHPSGFWVRSSFCKGSLWLFAMLKIDDGNVTKQSAVRKLRQIHFTDTKPPCLLCRSCCHLALILKLCTLGSRSRKKIMSAHHTPRAFLTSVLQNGVGRYVCQLQRITLKFCKSHASSRGMRWVFKLAVLKFPIIAQPCSLTLLSPKQQMWGEYHFIYFMGDTK